MCTLLLTRGVWRRQKTLCGDCLLGLHAIYRANFQKQRDVIRDWKLAIIPLSSSLCSMLSTRALKLCYLPPSPYVASPCASVYALQASLSFIISASLFPCIYSYTLLFDQVSLSLFLSEDISRDLLPIFLITFALGHIRTY